MVIFRIPDAIVASRDGVRPMPDGGLSLDSARCVGTLSLLSVFPDDLLVALMLAATFELRVELIEA
jgi:hypothetical protein